MFTQRPATTAEIAANWIEFTGGAPVVAVLGVFEPADVTGVRADSDLGSGVVTWAIRGTEAELVSIHVERPGSGLGRELMQLAEDAMRSAGAETVVLATSNDNLAAARFYLREGYRLTYVDLDAMDRVRELKPGVPTVGLGGVPLRDMWHFEKVL